jgi:hypothetical protein
MSLDLQLSGKTAIVTGGSAGIGKRDRALALYREQRKVRCSPLGATFFRALTGQPWRKVCRVEDSIRRALQKRRVFLSISTNN